MQRPSRKPSVYLPFPPFPPAWSFLSRARKKNPKSPKEIRKAGFPPFLLLSYKDRRIKKLKVLHFENEEGNLLKVFVTSVWEVVIPSKEPVRRRESSYDVDSAVRRGRGKQQRQYLFLPFPSRREIWAPASGLSLCRALPLLPFIKGSRKSEICGAAAAIYAVCTCEQRCVCE